jgi:2-amino-4-hydroxy-6-hydroxymethyldihydropteridine diphosphokinase
LPGPKPKRAYLGLGGNLGDPKAAMAFALHALDAHDDISLVAVSSLYKTPPWGVTDQPDFLNAVAAVDTSLSARALLDVCLASELQLKRVRKERWGPRSIDIDVLIYGEDEIDEEGLTVPHPRMTDRAFVLAPLAEIAPEIELKGEPIEKHLAVVDKEGIETLGGGTDWWKGDAH